MCDRSPAMGPTGLADRCVAVEARAGRSPTAVIARTDLRPHFPGIASRVPTTIPAVRRAGRRKPLLRPRESHCRAGCQESINGIVKDRVVDAIRDLNLLGGSDGNALEIERPLGVEERRNDPIGVPLIDRTEKTGDIGRFMRWLGTGRPAGGLAGSGREVVQPRGRSSAGGDRSWLDNGPPESWPRCLALPASAGTIVPTAP